MDPLMGLLLLGFAGGAIWIFGDDASGDEAETAIDVASLELVAGTSADETLDGNEGGDRVVGNGGQDVLAGNGGNDLVEQSGDRYSWLMGGEGDDILDASGTTAGNSLYGGAGADTLIGGEGNDNVFASGYTDSSFGGSVSDRYGDDGEADVIYGNGGDDLIHFTGGDLVSGGEGRDTYLLFDPDDATADGNQGVITDFDAAGGETVSIFGDVDAGLSVVPAEQISWTTSGDDVEVRLNAKRC
ncbi:MAG: calcium-binding protein [Paracoccaceae bacterium]|nr:calcium-binding protein [Paracoccaceae bacterium]